MRRLACLVLWIGLAAVPGWSASPIRRAAPEFPAEDVWVNAKPLTLARLHRRRVVLVAFFNTANINSLRALQQLERWHETYALDGLMVIGVHTPLYAYQRDPAFMQRELHRLKIDFPVVLDDDRGVWKSYQSEGWPSFFLLDRDGRVAFELEGEARYAEFETELRAAMAELGYDPTAQPAASEPTREDCGTATAETAVPRDRAVAPLPEGPITAIVSSKNEGTWARLGPWRLEDDVLRLGAENPNGSRALLFVYRGAQGFAVLAPPVAKKTRFYVRQDALWLTPINAGGDVELDDDGRSFVDVDEPRLYSLTKNGNDDLHLIGLQPSRAGSGVLAFSTADRCLPYAP